MNYGINNHELEERGVPSAAFARKSSNKSCHVNSLSTIFSRTRENACMMSSASRIWKHFVGVSVGFRQVPRHRTYLEFIEHDVQSRNVQIHSRSGSVVYMNEVVGEMHYRRRQLSMKEHMSIGNATDEICIFHTATKKSQMTCDVARAPAPSYTPRRP